MKNQIALLTLCGGLITACQAQSTAAQKQQIMKLAGCYEVSFHYTETYASDTAYKFHEPYETRGLEYVVAEEEDSNSIMLQHLLIIDDSTIIKHWREDWIKGSAIAFHYNNTNEWVKTNPGGNSVNSTWTQKVYQVDDAPRYESTGEWRTWGNHWYWESEADAPLPRREFTKRSDYNILNRRNRINIENNRIVFEQDNKKVIRSNGTKDSVLCIEKGYEVFTPVESSRCNPAIAWWQSNRYYWSLVRAVWADIYVKNNTLIIVNPKALYNHLFNLNESYNRNKISDREISEQIRTVILQNLKTSVK